MLMRRHHHPESPDYYSSLAAASAGVTSPSLSLGIISSSLEVCGFFFNLIIWSCLFIFSLFFLSFLPPFVFGDYEKTKNISVSTRCVFVSFCQNGILYLSIRRVFWRCQTHTQHTLTFLVWQYFIAQSPQLSEMFFLIGRQPHSPGCDLTNSRCRVKIISRWGTCWKKPK